MFLFMKIKYHTVFILMNKLEKQVHLLLLPNSKTSLHFIS